jgi:hypothetical protein
MWSTSHQQRWCPDRHGKIIKLVSYDRNKYWHRRHQEIMLNIVGLWTSRLVVSLCFLYILVLLASSVPVQTKNRSFAPNPTHVYIWGKLWRLNYHGALKPTQATTAAVPRQTTRVPSLSGMHGVSWPTQGFVTWLCTANLATLHTHHGTNIHHLHRVVPM